MRGLATALMVTLLGACTSAVGATDAGHARTDAPAPTRNGGCEACHADVAREWRASLHAQSFTDPAYQRAFAREALPFCTRCHAPEADPVAPEPDLAALGIGCITCHGIGEGVSTTRACESCHEFAFPDGTGLMQSTVTEHRASGHASRSCATCHMPTEGTHRRHDFRASRDPASLRAAATVTASRTPDAVLLRFAPGDIGHAFPTGDLFRRLRVDVSTPDGTLAASALLQRNTNTGGPDTRPFVTGAPADVRIAITAPGQPLTWRVVYERVEVPELRDGTPAVVEGRIEIASGTLP